MNLTINNKFYSETTNKTTLVVVSTNPFLSFTAYIENDITKLDDDFLIEKAKEWLFKLLFAEKAMPEAIKKVDDLERKINETNKQLTDTNSKIQELEKEQKVIAKYTLEAMTDEEIKEQAVEWRDNEEYPRFSYVIFEDEIYKLVHPKQKENTKTPTEAPEIYINIPKINTETGLQELKPSSENIYKKGTIGTYNGRVYKSIYDNNGTLPGTEEGKGWWEDLGTTQDYKG